MHGNVEQEISKDLRTQAASLDKECESNQGALAGLEMERTLIEEHYAEMIRRNEALVAHYHRSTEKAKAKAVELRRMADEIDKNQSHDKSA